MSEPDYNMREAAVKLRVHVSTLYNMINRGELRTYQVGGKARRVPREEIERIRNGGAAPGAECLR